MSFWDIFGGLFRFALKTAGLWYAFLAVVSVAFAIGYPSDAKADGMERKDFVFAAMEATGRAALLWEVVPFYIREVLESPRSKQVPKDDDKLPDFWEEGEWEAER